MDGAESAVISCQPNVGTDCISAAGIDPGLGISELEGLASSGSSGKRRYLDLQGIFTSSTPQTSQMRRISAGSAASESANTDRLLCVVPGN